MKKMLLLVIAVSLLSLKMQAQDTANYHWVANLDSGFVNAGHGIGVDPEGKIWYMGNVGNEGIRVMKKDGTFASFSPIKSLTYSGVTARSDTNGRGIAVDPDGNIVVVLNSALARFNYKTGECMNYKTYAQITDSTVRAGSLTKPGIDAQGNIYIARVSPNLYGNPIWILNPDFTRKGEVQHSQAAWGRAIDVSPDGHDVYFGTLWNEPRVIHFHSEDGIIYNDETGGAVALPEPPVDVFGQVSGVNFDKAGNLWLCDQTTNSAVYIYNFRTETFKKITGFESEPSSAINSPRGVGFSVTGDTVYVISATSTYLSVYAKGGAFNTIIKFDDFEDGNNNSLWGGLWNIQGNGTINFEVTKTGGYKGSANALHITGTWNGYGSVQAQIPVAQGDSDLTKFDGISFAAKAGANTNEAWLRVREKKAESDRGYAFFVYKFTPTAEWKVYSIPWDSLTVQYGDPIPPFDATDITYIDFAASKAGVQADYYLDDISFWNGKANPILTSVKDLKGKEVPETYSLSQNYPNPFNPSTKIQFSLKQNGNATLKVYDVVGREVASLINNQFMSAGQHEVQFNANNLTSGVYFYRLNVNGNVLTNKMMLMK